MSSANFKTRLGSDLLKCLAYTLLIISGFILLDQATHAAIFDKDGSVLPFSEVNTDKVSWSFVSGSENAKYTAIGFLKPKGCTAFIVANSNAGQDAPVYAFTNGHCINSKKNIDSEGALPENTVIDFSVFENQEKNVKSIAVENIVYTASIGTDLAVLELRTKASQLSIMGISPFSVEDLSLVQPEPDELAILMGIPAQGIDREKRFLRKSLCQIDYFTMLGESKSYFFNSIANKCSAVGGMSGSPLFSKKTNKIIGILNTGYDSSFESFSSENGGTVTIQQGMCLSGKPCEISNAGAIEVRNDKNYAQSLAGLQHCFSKGGKFDLNIKTCPLPRPNQDLLANVRIDLKPDLLNSMLAQVKTLGPFKGLKRSDMPGYQLEDLYTAQDLEKMIANKANYDFIRGSKFIEKYSQFIFGQPAVLSTMPSFEEAADTDVWLKTVFIDPKFSRSFVKSDGLDDPEAALEFFMVHEVCHYAYDLFVNQATDRKSLHGMTSYLLQPMNVEYNDLLRAVRAQKHAEIDGLAVMAMKANGAQYKVGLSALKYMRQKYSNRGRIFLLDMDTRIRSLEMLMRTIH